MQRLVSEGHVLYKLDEVIEGGLSNVIEPLIQEHQADLLKQLGADE